MGDEHITRCCLCTVINIRDPERRYLSCVPLPRCLTIYYWPRLHSSSASVDQVVYAPRSGGIRITIPLAVSIGHLVSSSHDIPIDMLP